MLSHECSHLEVFVLHSTENLQGTVGNATRYEVQFVNYAQISQAGFVFGSLVRSGFKGLKLLQ